MVLSDLTRPEFERASAHVRSIPPAQIEQIGALPEAQDLAQLYLREGVLGPKMHIDALHVAMAAISRVDVLVSWNFQNIVNLRNIRGFNAVNKRAGYPPLEIRPPNAVIRYEIDDPVGKAVELMRQIRDREPPPTSSR